MTPEQRQQIAATIDTILTYLWGILLLAFPVFMLTSTTDVFVLPKEILVVGVVLLSLLLWGAKTVITEKVTFKRNPFDLPVALFLFALLLSALFSLNRADSLIATLPVVVAGLGYFIFVNSVNKYNIIRYLLASLLIGGAIISLVAVFSFFKVYPLFFSFTHIQSFSTIGSLVEQAYYLGILLPIAVFLAWPILRGKSNNETVTFASLAVILAAGLLVTFAQLLTTQKPVLLPFETGFQTAFAAISQDTGRTAQGFLFGSGYGNFATVFTRFKQAAFNSNPNIWSMQFNQSSSFILELLATTGILGTLSFLFLLFRVLTKPSGKKVNPLYVGLIIFALLALVLPFSFIEIELFFMLLGLFAAFQSSKNHKDYYDVEFKFVTLKKGIISIQQVDVPSHEKHEYNRPTAISIGLILLMLVGFIGWMSTLYVVSDMDFQKSLVMAAANNGTATYAEQIKAISTFQYRSAYYRIFSQTNIALAGSLSAAQGKNGSPSAQMQSTLYTLIQQGISTSKQATVISPLTVANWQNLSSVYRSLIGIGQNSESFSIQASQQAIILDPNNPQEYLALGGIYYQLGQWDNAIKMFQQAIILKQDYANAYYNLGHAYEQKGDLQDAMSAYQAVRQLVVNDKNNTDAINKEISALQQKAGEQNAQTTPTPKPSITPIPTQAPIEPLNLSGQQTGPAGASGTTAPSPAPAQ